MVYKEHHLALIKLFRHHTTTHNGQVHAVSFNISDVREYFFNDIELLNKVLGEMKKMLVPEKGMSVKQPVIKDFEPISDGASFKVTGVTTEKLNNFKDWLDENDLVEGGNITDSFPNYIYTNSKNKGELYLAGFEPIGFVGIQAFLLSLIFSAKNEGFQDYHFFKNNYDIKYQKKLGSDQMRKAVDKINAKVKKETNNVSLEIIKVKRPEDKKHRTLNLYKWLN